MPTSRSSAPSRRTTATAAGTRPSRPPRPAPRISRYGRRVVALAAPRRPVVTLACSHARPRARTSRTSPTRRSARHAPVVVRPLAAAARGGRPVSRLQGGRRLRRRPGGLARQPLLADLAAAAAPPAGAVAPRRLSPRAPPAPPRRRPPPRVDQSGGGDGGGGGARAGRATRTPGDGAAGARGACPRCSAPSVRQGALERVVPLRPPLRGNSRRPSCRPAIHLLPDGPLLLRL